MTRPHAATEDAIVFMRLITADLPMDITASLRRQQATTDPRQSPRAPSQDAHAAPDGNADIPDPSPYR